MQDSGAIKAIDRNSVHRITSGQVVIDLQTAVKELVENSLDAGATNIEVRFKHYGLKSIEVIDNGSGIAEEYHESIALKHYTSKLSSFADLSTIRTFGFRGEALSSLCALSESVVVTTATAPPMGVSLDMDAGGKVRKKHKVARQRGTTVAITNLFLPLPVRRKEFDRNSKREFGKALALLNAYALGPCCNGGAGVRLTVTNHIDKGQRSVQLQTAGASSSRAAVSALWGPKALDSIVDLDLSFEVERDNTALKRLSGLSQQSQPAASIPAVPVSVKGLISRFSIGGGRTGTDRQFFYVNGRPCNLSKIQKSFNEVYRSFNANQAPFILADFIIPTDCCDINVSPDKRTIFLHGEGSLIAKLKTALEEAFAPSRSTYDISGTQSQSQRKTHTQSTLSLPGVSAKEGRKRREKDKGSSMPVAPDEVQENEKVHPSPTVPIQRLRSRQPSAEIDEHEGAEPQHQSDDTSHIPDISEPTSDLPSSLSSSSPSPLIAGSQPQSPTVTQILASHRDRQRRSTDSSSSPRVPLNDRVPSPVVPQVAHPQRQLLDLDGMDIDGSPDIDVDEHADKGSSRVVPSSSSVADPEGSQEATDTTEAAVHEAAEMVLDTRMAMWNRRSSIGDPGIESLSNVEEHPEDDDGPARKKRKSVVGAMVDGAERVAGAATRKPDCFVIGSLKPKRGMKIVLSEQKKVSTARDTRDELRSRLAGFARSGSQLPMIQGLEQKAGDEDLNMDSNGYDRDDSDEEVDQLDGSDDIMQDQLQAAVKISSKAQPLFATSRPSTPEAETEMQSVSRQSSGGAIDLVIEDDILDDSVLDPPIFDPAIHTPSSALLQEVIVTRPEVIRSSGSHTGDVSLRFDLSKITASWDRLRDRDSIAHSSTVDDGVPASSMRVPSDAGVSNTENDGKAEDALARVIEKQDFATMDIVGQFNLGFIITRRRKPVVTSNGHIASADAAMDDLFIVDQHAADEKYNFETLQQTTTIKSQKLFRPQAIELTASDELLAMENVDILRQNGFEVEVDSEGEYGQGSRLKLTAQPISKSTVFDMKDVEELIHLMKDRPTNQMVRCSKARAMFAMRACRKSVMIGMPLNRQQMKLVVQHMGTMDQPWNCPHGRPTMRHLTDIAAMARRHVSKIDWSSDLRYLI